MQVEAGGGGAKRPRGDNQGTKRAAAKRPRTEPALPPTLPPPTLPPVTTLAPAERGEGGTGEGGIGKAVEAAGGAARGAGSVLGGGSVLGAARVESMAPTPKQGVAATPTPKQSVAATPEPGMAAVRALLGRCRLEGYSAIFEEQGYDDLEFLLTLDRAGWG